jgi:hypothetical protein
MSGNFKKYLSGIIIASIVAFLFLQHFLPDIKITDTISYSVTIVTILSLMYGQWLWRINPFEKTPKLYKEYIGTMVSNYDNISRDMELKINQSLFIIRVFIKTNESFSRSITGSIHEDYGQMTLTYDI